MPRMLRRGKILRNKRSMDEDFVISLIEDFVNNSKEAMRLLTFMDGKLVFKSIYTAFDRVKYEFIVDIDVNDKDQMLHVRAEPDLCYIFPSKTMGYISDIRER